jgi:hypothetical protein
MKESNSTITMEACRIKVLNSAPGQVITHVGAKFIYDDGSVSFDPSNLPTNGLKRVSIPHKEAGYLFGKNNKCVKKFWVAITWTNGSASLDSKRAPDNKCWAYPEVELVPASLVTKDAKDLISRFELAITDPQTGQKKRVAVELSEEAEKAIMATNQENKE